MGIFEVFSTMFFVFMVYLTIRKSKFGLSYMFFGLGSLVMILAYIYTPKLGVKLQSLTIFVSFSLLLILFGLMIYKISVIRFMSEKKSKIASIVAVVFFMLFLFNLKGIVTYLFVPVLLFKLTGSFNRLEKTVHRY